MGYNLIGKYWGYNLTFIQNLTFYFLAIHKMVPPKSLTFYFQGVWRGEGGDGEKLGPSSILI